MASRLILIQDIETEFFIVDFRKISYLLENIEGLNKLFLIDFEIDERYINRNSVEKKRIYKEEDRITIYKFLKQSPIEINLVLNNISLVSELLILLIENFEDSEINSKLYVERFIQKSLSDNDWFELLRKIKLINKFLRIMSFSISISIESN